MEHRPSLFSSQDTKSSFADPVRLDQEQIEKLELLANQEGAKGRDPCSISKLPRNSAFRKMVEELNGGSTPAASRIAPNMMVVPDADDPGTFKIKR